MAYCATVTFHDETGAAVHTIRQGAVPNVDPAELCERLLADALVILEQRPGLRVVLLADGAPELWARLRPALNAKTLGTPVSELLDFWHLVEKLAPAAQVVYGADELFERRVCGCRDGAPAAQVVYGADEGPAMLAVWRGDLLHRNAAPDDIRAALDESGRRDVRVGEHRPVHDATTYLDNHRELLGYPGARRRGLPIGSGVTEATCKSLFTVRMKRSGARWKEGTARDVINLRALALSDRWNPALRLTLAPLRKPVRVAA